MNIENGCDREWERFTRLQPSLGIEVAEMFCALELTRPVTLWFCDGSPDRSDVSDGFHEWGRHKSLIVVRVYPPHTMPNRAVAWMSAHELRHAYQSVNDLFKNESVNLPHDDIPSEKDANSWASEFTDFDGVTWWNEKMK